MNMKVSQALSKVDSTLNVLFVIQILIMLKNIGWSLYIISTAMGVGNTAYFWGVMFRALLQGGIVLGLIKSMRFFSDSKVGLLFIFCLLVGFASQGSYVGRYGFNFNYGLFEIALVIAAIVFLVFYFNYKSVVSRTTENEENN